MQASRDSIEDIARFGPMIGVLIGAGVGFGEVQAKIPSKREHAA